ncbi:MAG: type II toxin-antitoxin system HipA family toxin [Aestuariivirga sp.]
MAGRLARSGGGLVFNYGRSYLAREGAISLYEPELPLRAGLLPLTPGLSMPNSIRDAAPDAWGRRVIINRMLRTKGKDAEPIQLEELTYLLESGSDRVGALDFQSSPAEYIARQPRSATLSELQTAAARVEEGVPLTPELDQALFHGSSIGGARPKAMIAGGDTKYIAKFSAQGDLYSVVKAEFVAMRLAGLAGLDVANVKLELVAGKDVILIARFDREKQADRWLRRGMVSALTLLELDEMMARYASYEELASIVRHRFRGPKMALHQLFGRLVFNVLCGNTDDHARNHAAYWNGKDLRLTPAYDICPQARTGNEASQAMLIVGGNRMSKIAVCLEAAPAFLLTGQEATAIAKKQIEIILKNWDGVCDEARLTMIDRQFFWRRQFLNPFAFEGAPKVIQALVS